MDLESRELLLDLIEVCQFKGNSYNGVGMFAPGSVYLDIAARLEEMITVSRTRKPIPKAIFLAPDQLKEFSHGPR